MAQNDSKIRTAFIRNRAEELGHDVWRHFVIPPYFDQLNYNTVRKPRVIIGGRGCGKTMLLRYLSHQSTFSLERKKIPDYALKHIGIYWRIDTSFANVMKKRGQDDDVWESAFKHLYTLVLSNQIIDSLFSIAYSNFSALAVTDVNNMEFNNLSAYDELLKGNTNDFKRTLNAKITQIEMWMNNIRQRPCPLFLPGTSFIYDLIKEIKIQLPVFHDAIYFIYIDEFENLLEYQQKIINTLIKHSEPPLIFNIAMKRNGFTTKETTGNESITDIADYRSYDLENLLTDDFPIFAAEIAFLNLSMAGIKSIPLNVDDLRDVNAMHNRLGEKYRSNVIDCIKQIFPSLSHEELANQVFEDKAIFNVLKRNIETALKDRGTDIKTDAFIYPEHPMSSITAMSLLYRKRLTPQEIVDELHKLISGEDNRFTGRTDWIHNNFIGCLLSLYEPFSRPCPFYAGFDTFCKLSRGNLRHFLELCHKSIKSYSYKSFDNDKSSLCVPPNEQAIAAKQTASAFLGEIRTFGRFGNILHTFVLRVGSLFSLAHSRKTQSEPEQSHFVISQGELLSGENNRFLSEAIKWSVLFEEKETKVKDFAKPTSFEYVLNPIYSPYFQISYRKGRKLEIDTDTFNILVNGRYDEYKSLMKRFSDSWEVNFAFSNPNLFSHLLKDN